ncbi:MAG: pyridoxamine 5'-phosphate oxidase family protein [Rubrimonas sp.]|uniref:pyridoxamine 5'-phosphate oxidase family protein n=1 Tax=Rubrimonas sp. TaxID=2036015 RepID=UPI002FDE44EF
MKDEDAPFRDDLDATLAHAWAQLARGAADRRSGFHTVQLATLSPYGPRVRTVVLRGAEAAARRLRVHSDARAAKIAEIDADPRVELCAYDAKAKVQLRLRGLARVHRADALADAAWTASGDGARVCYRAAIAPGAVIAAPALADPSPEARAPADRDAGRDAFTAVAIDVSRLEWLWLGAGGHRRAVFAWRGADWDARWLAP